MIHQPMGGARGQVTDIEIQAREIHHMKDVITGILVDATGKPKDQIIKDIDRDFYMSASQAKEYGIVDDVLVAKRPKTGKDEKIAPRRGGAARSSVASLRWRIPESKLSSNDSPLS